MSTLVRSDEAAAMLGVSKPTLYAYVSRGRLTRTTAPDGRTSLFDRDELEHLGERSRRSAPGPRPTIDVQIRSDVTTLHDTRLEFRGHDVTELATRHHFEDVAGLLWGPGSAVPAGSDWPASDRRDLIAVHELRSFDATPIGRMAMAAHVLDAAHRDDDSRTAARRLLLVAPDLFGPARRTGRYAHRLASAWRRRPTPALVDAIDRALALLADHELATSTLAVRIAASVRASPYAAFAAGLATMEGSLHGSASSEVHHFLEACAATSPAEALARRRAARQPVPGFGHQIYRGIDPRFGPLMAALAALDDDRRSLDLVDSVIAEVGRSLTLQPNVDLALGTLTWMSGLEADAPVFAVARVAGWAAHYDEELHEAPLRFRGVARPR